MLSIKGHKQVPEATLTFSKVKGHKQVPEATLTFSNVNSLESAIRRYFRSVCFSFHISVFP